MVSKAFFPTYIYHSKLQAKNASKYNAELLDECHKIREFDRPGRKWSEKSYVGGYTSYASIPKLHQFSSSFQELEQKITKHVKVFIKELEFEMKGREFAMSDFWLNMMPAQTTHGLHLHPNSFISGTYYIATPKQSAAIKFEDPRLDKFMYAPSRKANGKEANKSFVSIPVAAGNLVLFESWLRHEVSASVNVEERVSVSFNYNLY